MPRIPALFRSATACLLWSLGLLCFAGGCQSSDKFAGWDPYLRRVDQEQKRDAALLTRHLDLVLLPLPNPLPEDPEKIQIRLMLRNVAAPKSPSLAVGLDDVVVMIERDGESVFRETLVRSLASDGTSGTEGRFLRLAPGENKILSISPPNVFKEPGAYRIYSEFWVQTGDFDRAAFERWKTAQMGSISLKDSTPPPPNILLIRSNVIDFARP